MGAFRRRGREGSREGGTVQIVVIIQTNKLALKNTVAQVKVHAEGMNDVTMVE